MKQSIPASAHDRALVLLTLRFTIHFPRLTVHLTTLALRR